MKGIGKREHVSFTHYVAHRDGNFLYCNTGM